MRLRRAAILLLAVLVTVGLLRQGSAGAEVPETPTLRSPLPFDHTEHAPVFAKTGVACVDCHPIGLRQKDPEQGYVAAAVGELKPPLLVCHGCHRPNFKGAPRAAPGRCTLCHANRAELKPASHDLGWLRAHGAEARARGASCKDCHETRECVECHDARGAGQRDPHPPGWRTGHGVEARLDPYSCSTCHDGQKCMSCHTTGAVPW